MGSKSVFIIEDDKHIRELLLYKLSGAGFDVCAYAAGESGLAAICQSPPDVVLLDLMLPGIDGYEICRRIRANKKTRDIIIIMLTAKSEEGDKVLGLEIGADDYIVKPFSVLEVVARVRAVLRRVERTAEDDMEEDIRKGELRLLPDRREAYKKDMLLKLKTKEFNLLYYFMKNAGRVLSRKKLLDKIWGYDFVGETRTVDVHVSQLRIKIEDDPENPKYIMTLRGVGYKFSDIKKEEV